MEKKRNAIFPRSYDLLFSGITLTESANQILFELSPEQLKKRTNRLKVVSKYHLLRNTGIYDKSYQLIDLLMPHAFRVNSKAPSKPNDISIDSYPARSKLKPGSSE